METKHAVFSTTQIVATLSTVIVLINMYLKHTGKPSIELTTEEYTAIAIVMGNVWIQYRRFKPQINLHLKKK